ncbi:hypothetical protein AYI68_g6183 [Smittium mucronatum]|uniref:FHA domain-containing protein n=1 Tax=Smittium mucronatum TaxID=133383 RepID=A0A1R0GS66_9FUNG|nr:hypothetical protein AYI68_g6183 [Smittium mucronatum]
MGGRKKLHLINRNRLNDKSPTNSTNTSLSHSRAITDLDSNEPSSSKRRDSNSLIPPNTSFPHSRFTSDLDSNEPSSSKRRDPSNFIPSNTSFPYSRFTADLDSNEISSSKRRDPNNFFPPNALFPYSGNTVGFDLNEPSSSKRRDPNNFIPPNTFFPYSRFAPNLDSNEPSSSKRRDPSNFNCTKKRTENLLKEEKILSSKSFTPDFQNYPQKPSLITISPPSKVDSYSHQYLTANSSKKKESLPSLAKSTRFFDLPTPFSLSQIKEKYSQTQDLFPPPHSKARARSNSKWDLYFRKYYSTNSITLLTLNPGIYCFGRSIEADVRLNSQRVSGKHAELEIGDVLRLHILKTKNGASIGSYDNKIMDATTISITNHSHFWLADIEIYLEIHGDPYNIQNQPYWVFNYNDFGNGTRESARAPINSASPYVAIENRKPRRCTTPHINSPMKSNPSQNYKSQISSQNKPSSFDSLNPHPFLPKNHSINSPEVSPLQPQASFELKNSMKNSSFHHTSNYIEKNFFDSSISDESSLHADLGDSFLLNNYIESIDLHNLDEKNFEKSQSLIMETPPGSPLLHPFNISSIISKSQNSDVMPSSSLIQNSNLNCPKTPDNKNPISPKQTLILTPQSVPKIKMDSNAFPQIDPIPIYDRQIVVFPEWFSESNFFSLATNTQSTVYSDYEFSQSQNEPFMLSKKDSNILNKDIKSELPDICAFLDNDPTSNHLCPHSSPISALEIDLPDEMPPSPPLSLVHENRIGLSQINSDIYLCHSQSNFSSLSDNDPFFNSNINLEIFNSPLFTPNCSQNNSPSVKEFNFSEPSEIPKSTSLDFFKPSTPSSQSPKTKSIDINSSNFFSHKNSSNKSLNPPLISPDSFSQTSLDEMKSPSQNSIFIKEQKVYDSFPQKSPFLSSHSYPSFMEKSLSNPQNNHIFGSKPHKMVYSKSLQHITICAFEKKGSLDINFGKNIKESEIFSTLSPEPEDTRQTSISGDSKNEIDHSFEKQVKNIPDELCVDSLILSLSQSSISQDSHKDDAAHIFSCTPKLTNESINSANILDKFDTQSSSIPKSNLLKFSDVIEPKLNMGNRSFQMTPGNLDTAILLKPISSVSQQFSPRLNNQNFTLLKHFESAPPLNSVLPKTSTEECNINQSEDSRPMTDIPSEDISFPQHFQKCKNKNFHFYSQSNIILPNSLSNSNIPLSSVSSKFSEPEFDEIPTQIETTQDDHRSDYFEHNFNKTKYPYIYIKIHKFNHLINVDFIDKSLPLTGSRYVKDPHSNKAEFIKPNSSHGLISKSSPSIEKISFSESSPSCEDGFVFTDNLVGKNKLYFGSSKVGQKFIEHENEPADISIDITKPPKKKITKTKRVISELESDEEFSCDNKNSNGIIPIRDSVVSLEIPHSQSEDSNLFDNVKTPERVSHNVNNSSHSAQLGSHFEEPSIILGSSATPKRPRNNKIKKNKVSKHLGIRKSSKRTIIGTISVNDSSDKNVQGKSNIPSIRTGHLDIASSLMRVPTMSNAISSSILRNSSNFASSSHQINHIYSSNRPSFQKPPTQNNVLNELSLGKSKKEIGDQVNEIGDRESSHSNQRNNRTNCDEQMGVRKKAYLGVTSRRRLNNVDNIVSKFLSK